MKRIIICIALLCPAFLSLRSDAQAPATNVTVTKPDTLWRHGGFLGLNFNQASFTNWAAGGENSVGLTAIFSGFLNFHTRDSLNTWKNTADMAYGMLSTGGQYRKTADKIDIVSKYGRKAFKHVFYTGLAEFQSQFANGYNYPDASDVVSRFLAPGYVILSAGLDWNVTSYFDIYLSPATGKLTIVNDQALADAGSYGVKPAVFKLDSVGNPTNVVVTHAKETLYQFGAYMTATFHKDIVKNINFKSKLDLFDDYTDPVAANRADIVVGWENDLIMKINKYFSATILTDLLYNNDIPFVDAAGVKHGPRIQFEESLGVGFSMKF